jgi:aspartyl protease family protein
MPRPIIWAAGLLASATITGLGLGDRLGAFGLAPQAAAPVNSSGAIVVSADLQRHFLLHPTLDGRRIRMLVDTGASVVALSYEDARLAGIRVEPRDFSRKILTANGEVGVAPVRIGEIRVGNITVRNVEAVVLPEGRLATSLLGMSFLKRLGGFEIARGQLTLRG